MNRTGMIASRNEDGTFRKPTQLIRPEDPDEVIRKAAEVFFPAFEAFLMQIEKEGVKNEGSN